MVKIKICGITNKDDADAAIKYGADALGFIFYPKSPRAVSPETAKSIISFIPPMVTTVGVFVDEDKSMVEKTASYTGLNVIQFHGSEPPDTCTIDDKKVIKAIRVKELSDLDILNNYGKVSAFLLDAYSPDALGGTGQVFNWEIAVEAKKFGNIILAGGLNPDNVADAVRTVQPYAIDVASGVEGEVKGIKDHMKLRLFIENANKAL